MTRYHKALGFCLVTMFGMWGCARGPSAQMNTGNVEKIKALEVKATKLEDDLKAALSSKEQFRNKLVEAEETATQQQQEIARLQLVVKERDDLKVELKTRTAERDLLHVKYDGFLRELDDLTGRAKAALQNSKPVNIGVASVESKPEAANTGVSGEPKPKPTSSGISSGEPSGPLLNSGL